MKNLIKRDNIYYVRARVNVRLIKRSLNTAVKSIAQQRARQIFGLCPLPFAFLARDVIRLTPRLTIEGMTKTGKEIVYSPSDLIRFMESPFAIWMERYDLERPGELERDPEDAESKLLTDAGSSQSSGRGNRFMAAGR